MKTFPSAFHRMGEALTAGPGTAYATRKGKEFVSDLTDLEAYTAIADRKGDFVESLFRAGNADLDKSYGLSYEMWLWVHIFATEEPKKGPRLVFEDDPLTKIVEHFDRAAEKKIKFPKVTLETDEGLTVKLSRAGYKAKVPGSLNVTDGKPFGENKWFGRVLRDGTLEAGKALTDEVEALLADFNDDPAKVAKTHGLLTGNCCFCRKELTTGESLTAGYGPVCADKFGLPWGEVDPEVRDLTRHLPDEEANSLLDDGPNEAEELSGEDLANLAEAENAEDEIAWDKSWDKAWSNFYGDGHSPTV